MDREPEPGPVAENAQKNEPEDSHWLGMGVLAAASALAGGLAVAWFYRNTLNRLRQADSLEQDTPAGQPPRASSEGV